MKAVEYGNQTDSATALVTTNSICQGQQVPILWPLVFKLNHELSFVHSSFEWSNLASHNAGVTVVIVGIKKKNNKTSKKIFSIDEHKNTISREVSNINPYLVSNSTS